MQLHTQILDLSENFERAIARAAALIRAGALAAFPTETVYGLGADAQNEAAVRAIFAAKGRPADNPLIVHVNAVDEARAFCHVDETAARLFARFAPGPLTLVLENKTMPAVVTAGLPTVAVRLPANAAARALIAASGVPIAAPSANASGRPSPTTAQHVLADLAGKIPLVLDGGPCPVGVESTVLSLVGVPTLLRPGAITREMLEEILGPVALAPSLLTPLAAGDAPLSPGMKHTHYAPRARVVLAEGDIVRAAIAAYDDAAARRLRCRILASEQTAPFYPPRECVILGSRDDPAGMARALFAALRAADDAGVHCVVLEALPAVHMGLAYMNRALRAAGFEVVRR